MVIELLSGLSASECRRRGLSSLRSDGVRGGVTYSLCRVSDSASFSLLTSDEVLDATSGSIGSLVDIDGVTYRFRGETDTDWLVEDLFPDTDGVVIHSFPKDSTDIEFDPVVSPSVGDFSRLTSAVSSSGSSSGPRRGSSSVSPDAKKRWMTYQTRSDLSRIPYPDMSQSLWSSALDLAFDKLGSDRLRYYDVMPFYKKLRQSHRR